MLSVRADHVASWMLGIGSTQLGDPAFDVVPASQIFRQRRIVDMDWQYFQRSGPVMIGVEENIGHGAGSRIVDGGKLITSPHFTL